MRLFITPEDLEKVNRIKEIIEKDFKYHYTQDQLAQRVSTNERKLRDVFKQVVKMTIYEYLTWVRIEKAKELLTTTNLPSKMIASKIGYDNRNFHRQFKKMTTVSPLVWRRIYAQRCDKIEESFERAN